MLRAFGHPVAKQIFWPNGLLMLRHDGTYWVLLAQIWKWSSFSRNICGCCMFTRLARLVQQCRARACALFRCSIPNMSQHVATGWPNARNMLRPTMLRDVAFKCCDWLVWAWKCWANNVGICWNVAIVWPGLNSIDLSTRLLVINPTNSVVIPRASYWGLLF